MLADLTGGWSCNVERGERGAGASAAVCDIRAGAVVAAAPHHRRAPPLPCRLHLLCCLPAGQHAGAPQFMPTPHLASTARRARLRLKRADARCHAQQVAWVASCRPCPRRSALLRRITKSTSRCQSCASSRRDCFRPSVNPLAIPTTSGRGSADHEGCGAPGGRPGAAGAVAGQAGAGPGLVLQPVVDAHRSPRLCNPVPVRRRRLWLPQVRFHLQLAHANK